MEKISIYFTIGTIPIFILSIKLQKIHHSVWKEVWIHKTSLTPPPFIEVPVPSQDSDQSCFLSVKGYRFCFFLRLFPWILQLFSQYGIYFCFFFYWMYEKVAHNFESGEHGIMNVVWKCDILLQMWRTCTKNIFEKMEVWNCCIQLVKKHPPLVAIQSNITCNMSYCFILKWKPKQIPYCRKS